MHFQTRVYGPQPFLSLSVSCYPVPAAIRLPLVKEACDDGRYVDAEIDARRHGAGIDALLHLAVPEGLAVVIPAAMPADEVDRVPRPL